MSQTIKRYSTDITTAYKCQDCNYQSIQKYDMETHINWMHDVEVPKCNFCGYEYKWVNSLKLLTLKYKAQPQAFCFSFLSLVFSV